MIYIASPYSGSADIMEDRYEAVRLFTAIGLQKGFSCYSPIVQCHEMAKHHKLPTDFEYWKFFNFDHIRCSDILLILGLSGFTESKGVTGERNYAQQIRKPTILFDTENHALTQEACERFWEALHEQHPNVNLKRQFN